jgi:hypothetical protein
VFHAAAFDFLKNQEDLSQGSATQPHVMCKDQGVDLVSSFDVDRLRAALAEKICHDWTRRKLRLPTACES